MPGLMNKGKNPYYIFLYVFLKLEKIGAYNQL